MGFQPVAHYLQNRHGTTVGRNLRMLPERNARPESAALFPWQVEGKLNQLSTQPVLNKNLNAKRCIIIYFDIVPMYLHWMKVCNIFSYCIL